MQMNHRCSIEMVLQAIGIYAEIVEPVRLCEQVCTDPVDDKFLAATISGHVDCIVGGYFNNAGGTAAFDIAKWNGSSWSALSTGPSHNVAVIRVIPRATP